MIRLRSPLWLPSSRLAEVPRAAFCRRAAPDRAGAALASRRHPPLACPLLRGPASHALGRVPVVWTHRSSFRSPPAATATAGADNPLCGGAWAHLHRRGVPGDAHHRLCPPFTLARRLPPRASAQGPRPDRRVADQGWCLDRHSLWPASAFSPMVRSDSRGLPRGRGAPLQLLDGCEPPSSGAVRTGHDGHAHPSCLPPCAHRPVDTRRAGRGRTSIRLCAGVRENLSSPRPCR